MPPLLPAFQGNEIMHSYSCLLDQNTFSQTVFAYIMLMCIADVSLPLGLVPLIKTTCTTHVNLAAADAVGAYCSFRCFVPTNTWCRMEPQPWLQYSSDRYVTTLDGCVALTWWVTCIMSGIDNLKIRGTRVPLIWFRTKDISAPLK